jgi:hypothetical protein
MQTPTTIEGLRRVLHTLGYGAALDGVDKASPDTKDTCKEQVAYLFSEGQQTLQDDDRRRKALSVIERFPWGAPDGSDLIAVGIAALDDIEALLEEEQDLVPLEVDEVIEDENGEAGAIVIDDWESDEALEAAALALLRS